LKKEAQKRTRGQGFHTDARPVQEKSKKKEGGSPGEIQARGTRDNVNTVGGKQLDTGGERSSHEINNERGDPEIAGQIHQKPGGNKHTDTTKGGEGGVKIKRQFKSDSNNLGNGGGAQKRSLADIKFGSREAWVLVRG